MPIPENISLNHIQTSFLSLLNKIWPHLQQNQKDSSFENKNKAFFFFFQNIEKAIKGGILEAPS